MSTRSSLPQAKAIKGILEDYEKVVGQKVNFGKSKLIFINNSMALKFGVVRILGCGIEDFLTVYLGIPLFKGRMKEEYWNPILDIMAKTLAA